MCHQSVSLIARYLESQDIPTVIMGCALDIVEHAGVPRYWWSDFPLGHSAGKPHNPESQQETLTGALNLFDAATQARTTHYSPQVWSTDNSWQQDFMSTAHLNPEKIAAMQRQHEADRAAALKLKQG